MGKAVLQKEKDIHNNPIYCFAEPGSEVRFPLIDQNLFSHLILSNFLDKPCIRTQYSPPCEPDRPVFLLPVQTRPLLQYAAQLSPCSRFSHPDFSSGALLVLSAVLIHVVRPLAPFHRVCVLYSESQTGIFLAAPCSY